MENYKEARQKNRTSFLEKQRDLRSIYQRFCQKVQDTVDYFQNSLQYLSDHNEDITRLLVDLSDKITEKNKIQRREFTPSKRMYTPQEFRREVKTRLRRAEKQIIETTSTLYNYVNPLEFSLKELLRLVKFTPDYIGETSEAEELAKSLQEVKHLIDDPDFVEKCVSNFEHLPGLAIRIPFRDYGHLLETSVPSLPNSEKVACVKNNLRILEEEVAQENKKASEYFDTLEGKVLAYATYELEAQKDYVDDEEYLEFILTQAEKKSGMLGNNLNEILCSLSNLHDSGKLTTNDFIYVKAKIERNYAPKSAESKRDSIEEIKFRSELISHLLNLSPEESLKIANLKGNEDLERILYEFIPTIGKVLYESNPELGTETAKRLIRDNPNLVLIDRK